MTGLRRRLALRLDARDEAGFSLVEVLVALLIFSVVGVAVVRSFLVGTDVLMRNDLRNRDTQQLTVAMNWMTKVLQSAYRTSEEGAVMVERNAGFRTGNPPVSRLPTNSGVEATLYVDLGNPNGPSIVHWYVDTQLRLIEEVLDHDVSPESPVHTYHSAVPRQRVLATGVVMPSPGERPIFSWFDPAGPQSVNNPDPYVPISEYTSYGVTGVQLSLTLRQPNARSKPAVAENFVVLPAVVSELPDGALWPSTPSNPAPLPGGSCQNCGGLPPTQDLGGGGGGGGGGFPYEPPTGPVGGMT